MLIGLWKADLSGQGRLPGGDDIYVDTWEGARVSWVKWCLFPIGGTLLAKAQGSQGKEPTTSGVILPNPL